MNIKHGVGKRLLDRTPWYIYSLFRIVIIVCLYILSKFLKRCDNDCVHHVIYHHIINLDLIIYIKWTVVNIKQDTEIHLKATILSIISHTIP